MSHLMVITRPTLVAGFHLAGVEAFAADDAASAQAIVTRWLDTGETGLVAIDEELLAGFDDAFRRRLAAASQLLHLALPSSRPDLPANASRNRIAELLRQALGFHITFQPEPGKG